MKAQAQAGFSLIELMIGISILAILISLALPSFRTAVQNNRIASQANELVTAFHLARSEALKRNQPVIVCASSDGETCQGTWTDGWIVAEDNAPPGAAAPTIARVIRSWPAPNGGAEIAETTDDTITLFRFLPRGELDGGIGIVFPSTIAMSIPDCRGDQARNILINRAGRVSVETAACA